MINADTQLVDYDLTSFGLTQNQSVLYQVGLQVGTRTVSALARHSGLHRVLTYNILQELCKLGLATSIVKNKTGYYTMQDPKVWHERLLDKAGIFGGLLPNLQSLIKTSSGDFKVQLYQGVEGMKSLYDFLPQSKTDLKAFLGADHIEPAFREYLYNVYLPKRLAKGIWSRAIVSQTDHNQYFANPEHVPQTETIIVPDKLFDLSSELILFDNNKIIIACMSSEEMSGLLIESRNFYVTLEQIFELVWRIYGGAKAKAKAKAKKPTEAKRLTKTNGSDKAKMEKIVGKIEKVRIAEKVQKMQKIKIVSV